MSHNFTEVRAPICKASRNDDIIKISSWSTIEPKISRFSDLSPVELPKVTSETIPLFYVGNSSDWSFPDSLPHIKLSRALKYNRARMHLVDFANSAI